MSEIQELYLSQNNRFNETTISAYDCYDDSHDDGYDDYHNDYDYDADAD